jgi:hypothetical protein
MVVRPRGGGGGGGGPGAPGLSAYQVAQANGFTGTVAEWLASLEGGPGGPGASAYQVAVAAGFVGTVAAWLASLKGAAGLSAYQVAQANGFTGTEAQWLDSLKATGGGATDTLGAERVPSTLFTDPTKYTATEGWSVANGRVEANSGRNSFTLLNVLQSGKPYRIAVQYTKTGGINLRFVGSSNLAVIGVPGSAGVLVFNVVADAANLAIQADGAVFTGTLTRFSIKEISPLWT